MYHCYLRILTLFTILFTGSGMDCRASSNEEQQATANTTDVGVSRLTEANALLGSNPARTHELAREVLKAAEGAGDANLEHAALMAMAQAEYAMGSNMDFLRTGLRALDLARAQGDPRAMSRDLQLLSTAYLINGNRIKALEEARNSLALVLPLQEGIAIDEGYRFLLKTLLAVGDEDELFATAEKCLVRVRAKGDKLEEGRILKFIGEAYLAKRQYFDALPYLTSAGNTMRLSSPLERMEFEFDMVELLIGIGQSDKAKANLHALNVPELVGSSFEQHGRYQRLLFLLAKADGRWKEATALLEAIKQENDSANSARSDMRMAHMQLSYELGEKEKVNVQLRQENAAHVETLTEQWANNRILQLVVLVFGILIVSLVFISRYGLRMVRRLKLKNQVIRKQHDEIHEQNLELERKNLRLAESLLSDEEKGLMIKEIHHRTKNNLQVVDSLLQIQSEALDDNELKRSLKEAQGRIRSMGLVHEHIYRTADGSKEGLQNHIEQLVRNILVAHGAHDRISISVHAPMPAFHSDVLMPLTLLVNELVTNAVKYAFVERDRGHIELVLRPAGNAFELLFSDDGKGQAPDIRTSKAKSFGMELIGMLAEQLNGELRYLKGPGTTVLLTFMLEEEELRAAS